MGQSTAELELRWGAGKGSPVRARVAATAVSIRCGSTAGAAVAARGTIDRGRWATVGKYV